EHRKLHESGDVQYTDVGKGWILATSSCWRKSCVVEWSCASSYFYNTLSEETKKLPGHNLKII
ncbi:unnamed protein product, partial [Porites lobata]